MPTDRWIKDLERKVMQEIFGALEDQIHGLAASIVDPETSKHPVVLTRRVGEHGIVVQTEGSDSYAALLNDLLLKEEVFGSVSIQDERLVYFAHASEDKPVARPIVEILMRSGIEVWFDEWEIRAGDSLRRKMEEGLGRCTHFVVLLTHMSIGKRWVQEEIDVGIIKKVEKKGRFIGILYDLEIDDLSPFLKTSLVLPIDPDRPETIKRLIDDILEVSLKPDVGRHPQYVTKVEVGLERWSQAAVAVARMFVEASEQAISLDPYMELPEVVEKTGLGEDAASDGIMDLVDGGFLREHGSISGESYSPTKAMFVEFDAAFKGWSPKEDGLTLAIAASHRGEDGASPQELAEELNWSPRRTNTAIHYLEQAHLITPSETVGSAPWTCDWFWFERRLRRFVRENS